MLDDLEEKSQNIALALAYQPGSTHFAQLNDLREKSGVQDAVLLTMQGRILAFSSDDPSSFLPEMPSLAQLRQARHHVYGIIEPIPEKGLYLRVLAPVAMQDMVGETRILQLLQPVPRVLAQAAESVQDVYQDYPGALVQPRIAEAGVLADADAGADAGHVVGGGHRAGS